jgi:hypothetical protein
MTYKRNAKFLNSNSPPTKPEGPIVEEMIEFGHRFQIEKLNVPRRVGAGDRLYRLWENGHPATGGQWHYDIEGARRRAKYCIQGSYVSRISYLEDALRGLEKQLHQCRTAKPRFRVPCGSERV